MADYNDLLNCTGFEWDNNNADKIWNKHHVAPSECEQIFFNLPLIIADDEKHSKKEKRYYAIGRTDINRLLFIAFTVRRDRIRVISARDMSRKERKVYQAHEKENPKIYE
ncbi:MAG TPA: BrnT family toxin [Nitrospirae bacterium]|nr:BrnT family toxin [Nitrospirota bacterium]